MSAEQIKELPGLEAEAEPSSARLITTLGVAGFFSGLLLVGVYLFTLPMIQANRARALQAAIYEVLPGCVRSEALSLVDGRLEPAAATEGQNNSDAPAIYAGYSADDQLVGFAIPAEEPGFQDIISGILGFDAQQQVIIGFQVLESKETPGLGDKIMKDAAFQDNFTQLAVDPVIAAVKKGEKNQANEVEAITGATISSKAVVRLLNKGLDQWRPAIEEYLRGRQSLNLPKNQEPS